MKALDVDLRERAAPSRWVWGLLGVLVVAAVVAVSLALKESRKLEDLKAQRDELVRALARPMESPRPVTKKMPYDASAREMLALATSEWPKMLTALESVEMVGVTPVGIEVVPAERSIRVEVEFNDYASLLAYIDALNAGEERRPWGLVQAQTGSRAVGSVSAALSVATLQGSW